MSTEDEKAKRSEFVQKVMGTVDNYIKESMANSTDKATHDKLTQLQTYITDNVASKMSDHNMSKKVIQDMYVNMTTAVSQFKSAGEEVQNVINTGAEALKDISNPAKDKGARMSAAQQKLDSIKKELEGIQKPETVKSLVKNQEIEKRQSRHVNKNIDQGTQTAMSDAIHKFDDKVGKTKVGKIAKIPKDLMKELNSIKADLTEKGAIGTIKDRGSKAVKGVDRMAQKAVGRSK